MFFFHLNILNDSVLSLSDEEADETSCTSPGDTELESNKEEKKEVETILVKKFKMLFTYKVKWKEQTDPRWTLNVLLQVFCGN